MAAQTAEIIQFRPKPRFLASDNLIPVTPNGIVEALLNASQEYTAQRNYPAQIVLFTGETRIRPEEKKHKPYMTVRYGEDQWDGYRVNGRYHELTLTGLGVVQ